MVTVEMASRFWGAVEDCLVEFHDLSRSDAAVLVTNLWRSLPTAVKEHQQPDSYAQMIYHAEPWYIACNIKGEEKSVTENKAAYDRILLRNHLLVPVSGFS